MEIISSLDYTSNNIILLPGDILYRYQSRGRGDGGGSSVIYFGVCLLWGLRWKYIKLVEVHCEIVLYG